MILYASNISSSEWDKHHETMKRLRDKFIAHFDMNTESDQFPSMDVAIVVVEVYRDWLYQLFTEYQENYPVRAGFLKTEDFNMLVEREWQEKNNK